MHNLQPHSAARSRFICLLGVWITGLLDYWITGLLDYWITGLLDYWFMGLRGGRHLDLEKCKPDGIAASRPKSHHTMVPAAKQLGHELGDRDFVDKARERGRYELRQCFTAEFYQLHTPAEVDQALSEIIDSVLEITARVVADERAPAH